MFTGPLDESIIARAVDAGILDIRVRNIRDHTHDKHKALNGERGQTAIIKVLPRRPDAPRCTDLRMNAE